MSHVLELRVLLHIYAHERMKDWYSLYTMPWSAVMDSKLEPWYVLILLVLWYIRIKHYVCTCVRFELYVWCNLFMSYVRKQGYKQKKVKVIQYGQEALYWSSGFVHASFSAMVVKFMSFPHNSNIPRPRCKLSLHLICGARGFLILYPTTSLASISTNLVQYGNYKTPRSVRSLVLWNHSMSCLYNVVHYSELWPFWIDYDALCFWVLRRSNDAINLDDWIL